MHDNEAYVGEEAPTTGLIRHERMAGEITEVIASLNKEFELDMELGLKKQAEITVVKALSHDIDELTSSNDYYEVSPALLEKLFHIKSLRSMCFWSNLTSRITGFFKAGPLPLFLHALTLALFYPLLAYSMWAWPIASTHPTPLSVSLAGLDLILWVIWCVPLVYGFTLWGNRTISYNVLSVDISSQLLSGVTDKIPFGAKLKVLEAKKTGIFKDFVYVTPEFSVEKGQHTLSFPDIDPAILGVTPDNRRYMVVYWDIDKDVARVVKEIEHFKKFKLGKPKTS